MTERDRQLLAARQKLLDLTMRNRLLNFQPTKRKTIRIVEVSPAEAYDVLVVQEKARSFRAQGASTRANDAAAEQTEKTPGALRFLPTLLSPEELRSRLFYVFQQARLAFEEQGATLLYLALGFLEWTESPSAAQRRRAPLVLVPVELERPKVGASFRLRWTGEDLRPNISLQAKLAEQGVALPGFEGLDDADSVDAYLQAVKTAIAAMPTWRILTDVYVDFFSFAKFVMYKDLDPNTWPGDRTPADHPLITALFDPAPTPPDATGFAEDDVDERLRSRDVYHVLDADPSQIAVIEDVKQGRNLVVEGPPGTGKSQTITNLIAELLAAGKSVLFVSEKMAALEVVSQRLKHVGLGDFCLPLHSRKTNKRELLGELERTLAAPEPSFASQDETLDELDMLKTTLNAYAQALREPFGACQRSPFALFGLWEAARQHFAHTGREVPRVRFAEIQDCDASAWADALMQLRNLSQALPLVQPVSKHPWRGCNPGAVLPREEEEIAALIAESIAATHALWEALDHLVEVCTITRPNTPAELPQALMTARVMATSTLIDRHVLLHDEWNQPSAAAERLLHQVTTVRQHLIAVRARFHEQALTCDAASLREALARFARKFFRFLQPDYHVLKRQVAALYHGKMPRHPRDVVAELTQLADCRALLQDIRQQERTGRALFGSHWRAEESDPEQLRAFARWMVSFRRQMVEGVLATERVAEFTQANAWREQVEAAVAQVETAAQHDVTCREQVISRLGVDTAAVFGASGQQVAWTDWLTQLEAWQAAQPALQRWGQFMALSNACRHGITTPMLAMLADDTLEPADVLPCFEGNLAHALLLRAFETLPSLASFVGALHGRKMQRFMILDKALIEWNRQRLASMLYQNRPQLTGGASPGSEAGILLGELNRKRGHIPIRQLMSRAGGLIQKIKPCFMMSPLSVAQFLDPHTVRFDVVIFDEASQVRPEDALGTLLRGNQVVVLGDIRQLPPTSFFEHIVAAEEDEEPEGGLAVTDVESILHQCKRSFPSKTLRWYYRGKHESLIAVSNQAFYGNRLLVYPSPIGQSEDIGLQFVPLPEARYDRGRSSVNRLEARVIAAAAITHYQHYPDKSLGIGTFNIRQQQAILEEVEQQVRLHPELEQAFAGNRAESFFVKNLETIQGDERDVIFVSIGFGFDEAGRLSRNFGPLNHDGGERRLNVLFTRARERCVVFANFRARDLVLGPMPPLGLRVLKTFLAYAETRHLPGEAEGTPETDGPLVAALAAFLRRHDYTVHTQVGCADFRIDLAVLDPAAPGQYLLGIACDGPTYHTSRVARDRDRLRPQILTGLGWRLHRLWSPDWYRDRASCESALLDALERALETPRVTAPGMPSAASEATAPALADTLDGDSAPRAFAPAAGSATPVVDYHVCPSLGVPVRGELHDLPVQRLAKAVIEIVEVEGPVHEDEVIRRLRVLGGIKRSSKKLTEAVTEAVHVAERRLRIRRQGPFLWPALMRVPPLRRRQGDPAAKIDLICDEELTAAVRYTLATQHATLPAELITRSARLLGFRTATVAVSARFEPLLERLVAEGGLQRLPNGMIHLADA